jgi:hypothetical protein
VVPRHSSLIDHDFVRDAIQGMLKSVGLQAETSGRRSSLDFQGEFVVAASPHSHHLHHRYSDDGKGHSIDMVEFLTKPFRAEDLLNAIHQAWIAIV